ncbi:MAG: ABC transporter ATP-binding protein [Oscillospiraceae bacterium]|nr:ABC transporter ATP-binding protein [Oscillospiraceae bacterium]
MKKLLVYLSDYKLESILGPLFKLLEASFELLVPLVMAAVIDNGIGQSNRGYILWMCLLLVGLGIVGLVCSITAQYFAAKASVGFSTKLRHALFAHVQKLSFSETDTVGTSTLITRMTSDLNQVQSGLNLALRLFLRSPFVVFGAMIMAFTVDVKAALIFVVTIPLLSLVVFGLMLWSIPMYQKVQAGLDRVLGITRENLTGVRVIRAFGKEQEEIRRFSESNDALSRLQLFVGRVSALMNPVTYIIVNLAIIAVIWVGGLQVDTGVLTQGEVIALVNYMSQILVELIKLANLIITVTKALACARRISAVMETQSSMEDNGTTVPAQAEEAIVFDHVSLTYKGAGAESLSDISFTVRRGETVGIIGGTGSGKSSLVHLIPRFYDATAGRVLVDGVDVKEQPLSSLRSRIGIVMQKAVLFKGSIRENLRWGKQDATEEEMLHALDLSQAREFVDQKPRGLDERIEQGGKNLSGGQRQRLTIARALIRNPEILILDDSASALDFATDARLRKAIRENAGGTTVLIVSQRASTVQHADKIIVLDDGEMAGIGSHEELLESCPVYQEIYYSQFPKEVGV